ncbi:MAG TPA: DUF3800 domain-containing protein [Candidatus Rubrimentiphilum sp.]|nr:DUF3800 domain-containing protein [Candidatus Rubrimentiphilum sp.]
MAETKYIFIDESGTFDFRPDRSAFFVLTAVLTGDPIQGCGELLSLRHELLSNADYMQGVKKHRELSHFHCTEDPQAVRDRVFAVIRELSFDAYSVVVHKNRTNPALRHPHEFYAKVFKSLINTTVARSKLAQPCEIFASAFGLRGSKEAFLDGLEIAFQQHPELEHRIHFHQTASHHMLQVSDYVSWAIFRKWEQKDTRSFDLLRDKIRVDFPIFRHGDQEYY